MLEAKLPPPRPASVATDAMTQYGVAGCVTKYASAMVGMNKIDALKYQKSLMDPEEYKRQITALLVQLAQAQAALDK